ncbi:MAG: TPM domain-containing protein [Chitinophagales bacterium]|nr:TPM domain-containing protein [Chitinophagales bacterium]
MLVVCCYKKWWWWWGVCLMCVGAMPIFAQTDTTLSAQKLHEYRVAFWETPPAPVGWVTDFEQLFTAAEADTLNRLLAAFEKQTGNEMAVVTLDTFCVTKDLFAALSLHLANEWGVGKKGKDNGVLIALSRGHRQVRVNVGDGLLPLLPDAQTKQLIDEVMIPYFKNGQYYEGTLAGVRAVLIQIGIK